MASGSFTIYNDLEPPSGANPESQVSVIPAAPEKAVARTYHSVPQDELDNLQWGARLTGPPRSESATPLAFQSSAEQNDLEMSRPASPIRDRGVEVVQSISNPPINRFRMLAVSLMNFGFGLNDAALGALIPYIEKYA